MNENKSKSVPERKYEIGLPSETPTSLLSYAKRIENASSLEGIGALQRISYSKSAALIVVVNWSPVPIFPLDLMELLKRTTVPFFLLKTYLILSKMAHVLRRWIYQRLIFMSKLNQNVVNI